MKIIKENETLREFEAWSDAIDTQARIISEGKSKEFDYLIEELFPEGITEVNLNDILRFEQEWLFEELGIEEKK